MERNIAVLIDFENIATGCDKEGLGRFDVRAVMRRLKDKGRILVARAYADWGRWNRFKQDLVEEGVQMMELTAHGMQAKNRADIALAVDAMELAFTRTYLDTFVILSGDSDFTPLVLRLKELNRRVLGLGTKRSTSRLIADLCDEFTFYETVLRETSMGGGAGGVDEDEEGLTLDEAMTLLVETLENQLRDEGPSVHASVLKTSMKRKVPTFSEVELGFRTFARFVEAAEERGLVVLNRDERGGGYQVELPATRARTETDATPPAPRKAPPGVSEAGRAGLETLAEVGLELGTAADRAMIIDALVSAAAERSARSRSCSLNAVTGDVLRRCRTDRVSIPSRVVRGVLAALLKAGALIHPDGSPIRSPAATFTVPEPAVLHRALRAHALAVLGAAGRSLPAEAELELFGPEPAAEAPSGSPPAPATGEAPAEEAPAPGSRSRRGRGRRQAASGEMVEPPATPDAPAPSPPDAPAPEAPASVGEAPAEAPAAGEAGGTSPRKRRSRGGRRGRKEAAPAEGDAG